MLNNIGYKLAQLRLSRNMTQKDMAKILNVSQAYVGQWENETRVIPTEKLLQIAEYFEVSTDSLLGHSTDSDNPKDLKDIIRTETITYNGNELDHNDIKVIEGFLDAVLNKEN